MVCALVAHAWSIQRRKLTLKKNAFLYSIVKNSWLPVSFLVVDQNGRLLRSLHTSYIQKSWSSFFVIHLSGYLHKPPRPSSLALLDRDIGGTRSLIPELFVLDFDRNEHREKSKHECSTTHYYCTKIPDRALPGVENTARQMWTWTVKHVTIITLNAKISLLAIMLRFNWVSP